MSKAICIKCGKEMEYERFQCPVMCDECEKELWNKLKIGNATVETGTIDTGYVISKLKLYTPCLICNELIELVEYEPRDNVKVCDKCKQAIMKMRETIEHEDKGE